MGVGDDVVVVEDVVVEVLLVDVVVGCVVVVVGGRVVVVDEVVGGDDPPPETTPPTDVEFFGAGVPWTTELNGLPTASSISVTAPSAMAKTSAMTAMTGQRTPLGGSGAAPMMVGTGMAGVDVGPP